MAALTFVVLRLLASSPGVEISVFIDSGTVIVAASNLGDFYVFKTRHAACLVRVILHDRFIKHV